MTKKTERPKTSDEHRTTIDDTAGTPVIYFDGAPCFGINNGVVQITLAMGRYLMVEGQSVTKVSSTAHLRCSFAAAIELRDSLDKVILSMAPAHQQIN